MKKMKKMITSFLALVMVLGTILGSTTVNASSVVTNLDASKTGTLNITKKTPDGTKLVKDATFSVYKIMDLTPGSTPGEFAEFSITSAFAGHAGLAGLTPTILGNYSASEIEALSTSLLAHINTNSIAATDSEKTDDNGEATFSGLALGYYLVVETGVPTGYVASKPFFIAIPSTDNYNDDDAKGTEWIFELDVVPKNEEIIITKEIDTENGLQSTDSATVGDTIDFVVKTYVPKYADEYFEAAADIVFNVIDTMSPGLTFDINSVVVTVDGVPVPKTDAGISYWDVTPDSEKDLDVEASFDEFTIAFTEDFLEAYAGKTVTITYSADLNKHAVIGNEGNDNNVTLQYSNNPLRVDEYDEIDDDSTVYTFQIVVEKFAGTNTPLAGAKFGLYTDAACTTMVNGFTEKTTDGSGIISFDRLAEGTYYLKELESPVGYKLLINPIKIEIIADKDADGELTGDFTLKVDDVLVLDTVVDLWKTRYDVDEGSATIAVENKKGFTLPETGGMGVTLFLIIGIGGIALLSALMMKKRRNV